MGSSSWSAERSGPVRSFVALLAIAFTASPPKGSRYAPAVTFWLFTVVAALWVWWTAFHPYVACTAAGLVVCNPYRSVTIPWHDLDSVEGGYFGLIVRRRSDPRPIHAWAVQKSNFARWTGRRTRSDDVAREILAVAQSRST